MTRVVAVVFLLGCGINEVGGIDVLDASSGDVVTNDVVIDVKEEPVACTDAGTASCADAAMFRSPALFSADAGAPCPAGYDTHDLVLAVPNATTCNCTCTDNGPPSCDTTNVSYSFGAGNCTTGSGSYTLNGTCTAVTKTTSPGESLQLAVPAVTGGCGGGTPQPPAFTSGPARLCTPQCASDESVCTSQTGLRACVSVPGNVTSCPPNYTAGPFYIGANPSTSCDTCSCVEQGDCSGSTLHDFSDTNCSQGDQGFPLDGQCHDLTGGHIGVFNSGKIMPKITGATCNITQGASHTTYGGNDFTVCCK